MCVLEKLAKNLQKSLATKHLRTKNLNKHINFC